MSVIHVAVAVMKNRQNQVLIQQRAADSHQGGLWEFPGGKLEPGETTQQALQREVAEELGVTVLDSDPLIRITHDYEDCSVLLDVYQVNNWSGAVQSLEGQPLEWTRPDHLSRFPMPAADKPIVMAINLPSAYVITPSHIPDADKLLRQLDQLILNGEKLFLYRVKSLDGMTHEALINRMLQRCQLAGARLLIHEKNGFQHRASGIHLTEQGLHNWPEHQHKEAGQLLSVSCHCLDSLQKAESIGADFAMLSPVEATGSHPGVTPLGWNTFHHIVEQVNIPVFALGGMSIDKIAQARSFGAQGVAGISSWWQD